MRFGRINNDDSAIALGQYGYADAEQWRNLVVPGSEWRNWDLPAIHIMTGKNKSDGLQIQRCVLLLCAIVE
jgi:hypothetical protein